MFNPSQPFVEVTLRDGSQTIEAHNFNGVGCKQAVDDINKFLGGEVTGSRDKPELFNANQQVVNTVVQR